MSTIYLLALILGCVIVATTGLIVLFKYSDKIKYNDGEYDVYGSKRMPVSLHHQFNFSIKFVFEGLLVRLSEFECQKLELPAVIPRHVKLFGFTFYRKPRFSEMILTRIVPEGAGLWVDRFKGMGEVKCVVSLVDGSWIPEREIVIMCELAQGCLTALDRTRYEPVSEILRFKVNKYSNHRYGLPDYENTPPPPESKGLPDILVSGNRVVSDKG